MNPKQITELPAMLRAMADSIPSLPDFEGLPSICNLKLSWDNERNALHIAAQHSGARHDDDLSIIANLNTWASAIGGVLLLGDEVRNAASQGYYWRSLSTLAVLPNGVLFEVWDHLQYPIPADAAASEFAAV